MRLDSIEPDRARLVMPFRDELATIGDIVHGGALSALVDTAAMAASWSAHETSGPLAAQPGPVGGLRRRRSRPGGRGGRAG